MWLSQGSNATTHNCLFKDNIGELGAVFVTEGAYSDYGSTFIGNQATTFGGGMYIYKFSLVTLEGTKFISNYAQISGGTIYIRDHAEVHFSNGLIENSRSPKGGAI